jgi:hypothetical protein
MDWTDGEMPHISAMKARVDEPYVFSAQVQHVFYVDDPNMPGWKVVLHKKPWSKHILVSDSDEVTMLDNLIGVDVPNSKGTKEHGACWCN